MIYFYSPCRTLRLSWKGCVHRSLCQMFTINRVAGL